MQIRKMGKNPRHFPHRRKGRKRYQSCPVCFDGTNLIKEMAFNFYKQDTIDLCARYKCFLMALIECATSFRHDSD